MTETQKRIKELKKALPAARERIVAVAALLALSLTMMVSVSYAWYTLSVNPEIKGASTTVSANGNLEVALSDKAGLEPNSSGINDSFAAEGQTVHGANITWGNLINLANNYGLESLTLRPAKFVPGSSIFLKGVQYGDDGRVEGDKTDFYFTTWQKKEGTMLNEYEFGIALQDAFGVRAISSVGYKAGDKGEIVRQVEAAEEVMAVARNNYQSIMKNPEHLDALTGVVQKYLNNMIVKKKGGSLGGAIDAVVGELDEDPDITPYVPQLLKLYDDVLELCIKQAGESLAMLANIQQMAKSENGKPTYQFTADTLYSQTSQYNKLGINLGTDTVGVYREIYKHFSEDRGTLEGLYNAAIASDTDEVIVAIDDSQVSTIIGHLVAVSSANIEGQPMNVWMQGVNALTLFQQTNSGDTIEVQLTGGDIYKFERLSGEYMDTTLTGLSIGSSKTNLSGHLTTTARDTACLFARATSITKEIDPTAKNNLVAQDTYGMVLDLWFRTNSEGGDNGALLTLDGMPNVTYDYEVLTITPPGRDKSPVFIYNRPFSDSDSTPVEVYCIPTDRNGDDVVDQRVFDPDSDPATDNSVIAYEGYYYTTADFSMVYKTVLVTGDNGATTPSEDTSTPIDLVDISSPKINQIPTVHGYETSNRVWDDANVGLGADAISTTQGSGSCYVFYAPTPTAAASSLEMLRNMRLAFVDINGTYLATAILDVDYTYASAGKYVVPITIDETKENTPTAKNKQGEDVYGFAYLKKNVATRISVVIYLEGEGLENNMVMTSDSINGRLNLQFSTVDDLLAMGDSALEMDTISLGAFLADNTNVVEASYTGSQIKVPVTAQISGLTAKKVQVAFQRKINDYQGSQMQIVDMELKTDANNNPYYYVEYPFNAPGEYVLRSLIVDGVTYDLPNGELVVDIAGLELTYASFCDDNNGTALTTDNFVERPVKVSIEAGWEVQNVTAHFESVDDNTQVSTSLTKNGDYWTGTARFTSSGTYYLAFVEVDGKEVNGKYVPGEYYTVPESMQGRLEAKLGLRASVLLENSLANIAYEFNGLRNIAVSATILTDTGEPLRGLSNVEIYYGISTSTVLGDGLHSVLPWNNGVYAGEFPVDKVGAFSFAEIRIGTVETGINTIRVATSAPTLTVRPKDPPNFAGYTTKYGNLESQDYIVISYPSISTPLCITTIENAATATSITAIFTYTDENGNTQEIPAVWDRSKYPAVDNKITFEIPAVPNADSRNGKWELSQIQLVDVYDVDGTLHDANDPYILRLSDVEFAVVERFSVSVDSLTTNKPNGDAGFMEQQKLTLGDNDVNISLSQYAALLSETGLTIKNAKLELTHQAKTNETYGYYTFTGTLAEQSKSVPLTASADAGKYVFSADTYIALAGVYDAIVTFDVYDGDVKVGSFQSRETFANKLTVKSAKPEVKIDSISPTPGTTKRVYTVSEPTNQDQLVTGDFFRKTDYSAVVYIHTPVAGNFDQEAAEAYAPLVTLSVTGVSSSATNVTMEFATKNASSKGSTFTFTNGKSSAVEVGKAQTGVRGWFGVDDYPECYAAGRMTQDKLTLTYGGAQFTVTVKHEIVLDNPQAPTVLMFTGIPDSYTGTKPAQIAGEGSTVTVTLPSLQWTARIEEPKAGTWSAFTSAGEVTDASGNPVGRVYGYRYYTTQNSCGGTDEHHEYQYYYWTKFQSSITASTDIYTQAKKIDRWKIGDKYYNPGDTVTISGEGIITAEAVVVDVGTKTFVETVEQTTTRTQYGYVKDTSTRTSKNGGEQIGAKVGQGTAFPAPKIADATKAKADNDEIKDVLGTNMTKDSGAFSTYWP